MNQIQVDIIYKRAITYKDFEAGKLLFKEYADSLGIDLAFQDFKTELKTIHQQYYKPGGALIIAYNGEKPVGCAGIRKLDPETAELKRMYVNPGFRGNRIGQDLLELCIRISVELKYKKIRLDTLPEMRHAQTLYLKAGFYEIPSYRNDSIKHTIYMEKKIV